MTTSAAEDDCPAASHTTAIGPLLDGHGLPARGGEPPTLRHDVGIREGEPTRLHHSQVGNLLLRREKLAISGPRGQLLVVHHAEHGSATAGLLALLGPFAAMPGGVTGAKARAVGDGVG